MDAQQLPVSFVKVLVVDAERSARFYEALGFERVKAEPPFILLRWKERGGEVFLVGLPGGRSLEGRRGTGVLLGFRVEAGELPELLLRAQSQGADVEGPLHQPWHTRELLITDPDGYRLNFIEPL
jgi:catechol 2,3-dioxygenase-like lactoylglutathione lyase family enzyme